MTQAQTVKVVEWNFTNATTPLNASTANPAVSTSPVPLQGNGSITLTRVATNPTYESAGTAWSGTEDTGFITTRTSLTPRAAKSFSANFTLTPQANGDWSNLTMAFAYQRAGTAPNKARAVLTWQEGAVFKRRYTAAITLSGTAWGSSSALFQNGDALPASLANLPCLLEVYFWGTSTTPNNINVDDVRILCNSLDNVFALYPASLRDWQQGRAYSLQYNVPGFAGTPAWSISAGALPAGLTLNAATGEISGTPTTTGSSGFTITATGTGLNTSKAYTLNITAPSSALPTGNSIARLTFDGDTSSTAYSDVPATDCSTCFTELSFGFDASGTMSGSLHAGGKNAASSNPINTAQGGQMRCFAGWDSSYGYATTRNSLTHYNNATGSNARFGVYPATNSASIPTTSQTNVGENAVWQTRVKLDPNASGNLQAFYFDALRWQKDLMDVSGANGPRWAELHAYWTDDSGALQHWDSSPIDISAIYLPEQRAVNQFGRYVVDLNSGATSLNQRIKSTTSKYRTRTIFFDLYFWHDTGADLSGIGGTNPPVILLDEIGLVGDFICTPPVVGIGNTVFNDTNYNGRFDPGEGIAGVKVELLNTSGTVLQSTTTTSGGNYLFSGLAEGSYKVRIPASEFATGKPLYQMTSVTGAGGDDGIDDDVGENGIDDPAPATNGISSGTIVLAMDNEPTTTETGNNGAADNSDDDNTDLTVDFGFVSSPSFAAGNRIFKDVNGNGTYDPGEGCDGVTVELLSAAKSILASQITSNGGRYYFPGLASNQSYYVRVAASNFISGGSLESWISVPGNGTDNGIDDDDNGADDIAAASNGILSTLITPDANQGGTFSYSWPPSAGATSTNEGGTWYQVNLRNNYVTRKLDVCVSLDTTTQNTQALWMAINNGTSLSGADSNYAAMYLANGIVTVTPYAANPTTTHTLGTVIATTPYTVVNSGTKRTFKFTLSTDSVNQWSGAPSTWLGIGFPYDAKGGYPDPFNKKIGVWIRSFADGAATLSGSAWTVTYGSGSDPNIGSYTDVSPLTEIGADTTIDFGFQQSNDYGDFASFASASSSVNTNLRLGALVDAESSATTNSAATGDDTTGVDDDDGVTMPATINTGVTVTIPVSVFNNTGALAYLNAWIDFNNDGTLSDTLVSAGGEKLMAEQAVSSSATAQTVNLTFTVPATASVGSGRGVRFRLTSVSTPTPAGFKGTGEVEDYIVAIAAPVLTIGNLVWNDSNNNGVKDATELGIGGATVQLYLAGADNTANTADDVLAGTTTTSITGGYQFGSLAPGKYFVKVTPPAGYPVTSGTPATTDNNVDNNNDGSQPGGAGTALFSPVIDLASGAESTTDGDTDANTNLTVDFGLFTGFTVGNLVFNDANNNGVQDTGESGIAGVTVELLNGTTNVSLATTTTNASGNYGFLVYTPGSYKVRVTAPAGYPLVSAVTGTDNGTDNNNDGTQSGGAGTAITSFAFNLSSGTEPGTAGTTNTENTIDFGLRAPATDFGDYPSFASASQIASTDVFIGTNPTDAEATNPTTGLATADDSNGTDDDDLVLPAVGIGGVTTFKFPVTISGTATTAMIGAWADWNGDNDVLDANETLTVTPATVTAGTTLVSVTFSPPAGTTAGTKYVRFRVAEGSTAPAFTGASTARGEVEDYAITASVPTLDFGDYVGFGDASSTVISTIKIGSAVDAELAANKNGAATGDDLNNTDDEDGVSFGTFIPGASATVTVTCSNSSGSAAYLNAWIDWNENGVLTDGGEQVATNVSIPNGSANLAKTVTVAVPATARGTIPMRVRLTSTSSPTPLGQSGNGEVEDHLITIASNCQSQLAIYDAIILNNLNTPADIEGRTVVKNITGTNSFTMALMLAAPASEIDAAVQTSVAAGNPINLQSGSFWAPSSTSLNGRIVNYNGGGALVTTPAFDFASVFNGVISESSTYAAMTVNSSVTIPTSPAATVLSVGSGVANGTPAVFSIDGNTLLNNGNVQTLDLNLNGKTPSAIIINLTGTSISYSASGGMIGTLAGTAWRPKILWNFPTATTLNFQKNLYGCTLAPNASLTATGGAMEGAVCVKDYNGTIEIHLPLWTGGSSVCTDASDSGDLLAFADASSTAVTNIKLGANPGDVNSTAIANTTATGDDQNGTDDEDGVTFGTLPQGGSGTITVNVTNTSGSPAYLNGWIDWNNNGALTDTGEQVIANVAVATGTSNSNQAYTISVPATVTPGQYGARFRFTSTSNPGPAGYSGNGEVEDYLVTVTGPNTDFGDYSGFANASSFISTTLKIGGNAPDGEASATTNTTATGDDTTNQDDEDGVTLPALMTQGTSYTITVNVNNTSGSTAYLNAWFDWNNNGSLADVGEQAINNVSVANGIAGNQTYTIAVPANATVGTIGARFRLTSTSAPGPTGASGTGEVEDYVVSIVAPTGYYSVDGTTAIYRFNVTTGAYAAVTNAPFNVQAVAFDAARNRVYYVEKAASAWRVGYYSVSANTHTTLTSNLGAATMGSPLVAQPETLLFWANSLFIFDPDTTDSFLLIVDMSDTALNSITEAARIDQDGDGLIGLVKAATIDGNGIVYFSSNSEFSKFDLKTLDGYQLISSTSGTGFNGLVFNSGTLYGVKTETTPKVYAVNISTGALTTGSTVSGGKAFTDIGCAATQWPLQCREGDVVHTITNCPSLLKVNLITGHQNQLTEACLFNARACAYDPVQHAIYYTEESSVSPQRLAKFDLSTFTHTSLGDLMGSSFTTKPNAMIDALTWFNGKLYYINQNTDDLIAISYAGNLITGQSKVADIAANARHFGTVSGLAIDSTGNLFITSTGSSFFGKFNIGSLSGYTALSTSMASMESLAFHPVTGQLYGASTANPFDLMYVNSSTGALTDPNAADGFPGLRASQWMTLEDMSPMVCSLPDHGDYSGFADASSVVNNSLKMGSGIVDAEFTATTNATATGDDASGSDDEDGVNLPSLMTLGSTQTITVTLTNTSGAPAYLNGWIDWNNNGVLTDTGEQVINNVVVANGVSAQTQSFSITVPATATVGPVGARFRITSTSVPGPTGASGSGEVEDYVTTISAPAVQCSVVVAYYDNTIYTFSATGGAPDGGIPTAGSGLNGPYGMKQGPDGNIYVTSSNTNQVLRFNINTGAFMGAFVSAGSGGLSFPTGLAFGPDGNLYVSSTNTGSVKKYNGSTGAYISDFAASVISATPNTYTPHQGIAFGPDGNLYVADNSYDRVLKFSGGSGAFISVFAALASGAYAKGEAFGPDGNLYVVQQNLGNVVKISGSTGANLGIFADLTGTTPTGLTWNATDGHLYVNALDGKVRKFNGSTGAFISNFIDIGAGGPKDIVFTNQACPTGGNCGVGNILWCDKNGNNKVDANEDPPAPVTVLLFKQGDNPLTATPLESRTTGTWGKFRFAGIAPGSYFLHVPPSQFQSGGPLFGYVSITGNGTNNGVDDDDNGIDVPSPATTGVNSVVFALTTNGEPTDAGTETGLEAGEDLADDNNVDLTIDLGFVQAPPAVLSIGNLVWNDANNNGVKDAGELGVGGAVVSLFQPGADGLTNTLDDVQVGSNVVTGVSGAYQFTGLAAGSYFVKVTPPSGYPLTSGTPATADNNIDNNNDGAQPGGAGTALISPLINLTAGAESVTDGDTSADTNMTVDFGLFTGFTVGNLVFADTNNNGVFDAGESGISGVTVELLNASTNAVLATTTTNSSGQYGFLVYVAGSYKVRVTPNASYPLASTSTGTDNGTDKRNDGTQSGLAGSTSTSFPFTLSAASEPGSTGSTNTENTIDFGFRPCPTITISPTAAPTLTTGILFSQDMNASGGATPYTFSITSGSLPPGLSLNSSSGIISGTPTVAGAAPFTLTAQDAKGCKAQLVSTWSVLNPPSIDFGDYSKFGSAGSTVNTNLRVGALVDAEYSSQGNISATGDDTNKTDDEDGVTLPEGIAPLLESTIDVAVTNLTGSPAYLNVWVDYNQDGLLTGPGEQVATNIVVAAGTSNAVIPVVFTPPATIATGFTGVRVRLTNTLSPGSTGTAGTGEVEDHIIRVCPAAGFAYGTGMGNLYQINVSTGEVIVATAVPAGFTSANGAAYAQPLGVDGAVIFATGLSSDQRLAVWDRTSGVINVAGNLNAFGVPAGTVIHSGDFYNGCYYFVADNTDDLWRVTIAGSSGSYAITSASKVGDMWNNTQGHQYGDFVITPQGILYSHAWRSSDGQPDFFTLDLTKPTPQATLLGRPAFGHNGITLGIDGKLYGGLGVNSNNADWFQVSLTNGQSSYLNAGFINGLTDMTMGACAPAGIITPVTDQDFGDYGPFSSANSKVDTAVRLGALVDADTSVYANLAASGDDSTGVDDEDGVTLPATIQVGSSASVSVKVTNTSGSPAYLSAWIDLNGNYSLVDAGEKFINNITIPTGTSNVTQNYTLNVPLASALGNAGLRFRLSSVSGAGPDGAAGTGEVEDYMVTLVCPTITIAPSPLPNAMVSQPYSTTLTASTGIAPFTWALTSGSLPSGITLNSSTGVISGTAPSTPSVTPIVIGVTDARGCTGSTGAINFTVLSMSIGNQVFHDANCNGIFDSGDTGIGGVTLQLFNRGADGIAYNADDAVVTSTTSAADGTYRFNNLAPGTYWVKLTPPSAYPLCTPTMVTLDNSIDNDSNGSQPGGGGTAIRSPVISLTANGETTTEDADANTDLTVDFGLRPGFNIGDTVFKDENNNGIKDPTEAGLSGISVTLMSPGADGAVGGGDDTAIMTTTTNASGVYNFRMPTVGKFFIRVTPITGFEVPSGPVTTLDNGVDNDNNGVQPGGAGTYIYSPVFDLAQCTEPGTTGGTNNELSIDFGLVPSTLGLGNLVFDDVDGSGHFDLGEGLDGVSLELYASTQTPGVDTPLATTTTANGGRYLFEKLTRRSYFVYVPKVQFGNSGRLRAMFSVPGVQSNNSDDDLGEDSIDAIDPSVTGIRTRVVSLDFNAQATDFTGETGFDATSDNTPVSKDDDYDLTLDIGLYRRVGVGNLVFVDTNGNGRADSNEGINGVTVQLYKATQTPGVDTPLLTTTTAGGGKYLFKDLQPGLYVVHLPKSNFQAGGPLVGKMSIAQGQFGDDDVGEDGLNDTDPPTQGVSCNPVFLQADICPTLQNGETGIDSNSDDDVDAAIDLTIDFGFQNPVAVGNLVFIDANGNGHYDSGEGVDGVTVELYRSGSTPGSSIAVATKVTSEGGHYLFDKLAGGTYFVHIPASNFGDPGTGAMLFEKVSMSGTAATGKDDDVGEKGLDSASPVTTGISSADFTLSAGSMPINSASETGFRNTDDDANSSDSNGDMTIDFGFVTPDPNRVGVGNTVFNDLNGNGHYDDGEGIDGVTLALYSASNDQLVSTTTTSGGGLYLFSNLPPGTYYIRLSASNWWSFFGIINGKLIGLRPLPGQGGDNGFDDDVDENGDDPSNPEATGVRSTNFTLTAGAAPTDYDTEFGHDTFSDFGIDDNINLTIDFGFYKPVGVGDLVFVDSNANGKADSGEGVAGVTVKLFKAGDDPLTSTPVATQVTSSTSKGKFQFNELKPGYYFLHVPASMFQGSAPLVGKVSMTGVEATSGDDNAGEDGIDPPDIVSQGISTDLFLLSPGSMPSTTTERGLFGNDDNGSNDVNVDLTHDFGFTANVCAGNLVFRDNDRDGKFTSGVDQGVNGVTVELWRQPATGSSMLIDSKVTANGGKYQFCVPAGTYQVKIPASMFQTGGPLANTQATTPGTFSTTTSSGSSNNNTTFNDDNVSQDAQDGGNAAVYGAYTSTFTLNSGTMPTGTNGETGFDSSSDNAIDADSNLTIDLGFKPKAISVGNLVFKDTNNNGKLDAGETGIANVTVKLFNWGTDPNTGTPVATTTTATNGTYALTTYAEGQYFVHIAKTNFNAPVVSQTGTTTAVAGPLYGLVSSTDKSGSLSTGDDNVNENGIDAPTPLNTGISTGLINLIYGSLPINTNTEAGYLAASDDTADANGDMTIDFGFRLPTTAPSGELNNNTLTTLAASSLPGSSFKRWKAGFASLGDALADDDHDGLSNLLEYALGTDPLSGVLGAPRLRLEAGATIDALLTHPAIDQNDLRITLERSADLSTWTKIATTSTSSFKDDKETVRYINIASTSGGYVRARVELDSDLDGTAEATATTPVLAYQSQTLPAAQTTLAMPLTNSAIYSGEATRIGPSSIAITHSTGLKDAMQSGTQYFVELSSGHRFDLDVTASSDEVLSIDLTSSRNTLPMLPENFSGRVSVRAHWTLGSLLPVTRFHGSTSANSADRVLFYDNGWQTHWLYASRSGNQWISGASLSDTAARVIDETEGFMVQPRSGAITLPLAGELRTIAPAVRKSDSQQLLGGTALDAITAEGDSVNVWNGDLTSGASGYSSIPKTATTTPVTPFHAGFTR